MNQKIREYLCDWVWKYGSNTSIRKVNNSSIAIGSHSGIIRSENQDRVAVFKFRNGDNRSVVAIISDGIGGLEAGDKCAAITVSTFLEYCGQPGNFHPRTRLHKAAQAANQAVHDKFKGKGGATLTAVYFERPGLAYGINIGDSRIYRIEDGIILQISTDDTLEGQLKSKTPNENPRRELLQFIGMGKDLQINLLDIHKLSEATTLLLSTDGAHIIGEENLLNLVRHSLTTTNVARRIIELSLWWGGRDNSSVIIAQDLLNIHALQQCWPKDNMLEISTPAGDLSLIDNLENKPSSFGDKQYSEKGRQRSQEKHENPQSPTTVTDQENLESAKKKKNSDFKKDKIEKSKPILEVSEHSKATAKDARNLNSGDNQLDIDLK